MNEENSLWMGDIPPDIDESKISQSFQYFNIFPTNIKLIKDKKTNTNKNYCFVFFKNNEDTNQALNQLNGKIIPNTTMTFKLNRASYHSPINRTIYVGNLNKSINNETLLNFFHMRYSSVIRATVIKEKGVSKGYGFVVFKRENEYKKSLEEMDGTMFEGKKIVVREQKKKEDDEYFINLNKLNYNGINNFTISNSNDHQINENNFGINNINKDLLINYNIRNNNGMNDSNFLNSMNILNNNNILKNGINNNLNISSLINNKIININNRILNQSNNIINLFNIENKNTLNNMYIKEESNQNFINNKFIINQPNVNKKENPNIDINKLFLFNNINKNISNSLNKNFININDNNHFNAINKTINISHNQNIINNKINIKNDFNSNGPNFKESIINKKNKKNKIKLEVLEEIDEKTLIKKIEDSINKAFNHYKMINISNGTNKINCK
jgi:RNA recognition motif-containing protein